MYVLIGKEKGNVRLVVFEILIIPVIFQIQLISWI